MRKVGAGAGSEVNSHRGSARNGRPGSRLQAPGSGGKREAPDLSCVPECSSASGFCFFFDPAFFSDHPNPVRPAQLRFHLPKRASGLTKATGGAMAKNPPAISGGARDRGFRSRVGKFPWGRKDNPLSILAWRIPRTEEAGGLLSMGSHRVGHD